MRSTSRQSSNRSREGTIRPSAASPRHIVRQHCLHRFYSRCGERHCGLTSVVRDVGGREACESRPKNRYCDLRGDVCSTAARGWTYLGFGPDRGSSGKTARVLVLSLIAANLVPVRSCVQAASQNIFSAGRWEGCSHWDHKWVFISTCPSCFPLAFERLGGLA